MDTPPVAPPGPIPVVRAIIEDAHGKVLLLRRANTTSGNGAWCLPGGKVDLRQTIAEALAREILEETSLQLISADFLLLQDSLPTADGPMHCINFYFRCRVRGELILNHESDAFAWVAKDTYENHRIVFQNDAALRVHFSDADVSPYTVSIDS